MGQGVCTPFSHSTFTLHTALQTLQGGGGGFDDIDDGGGFCGVDLLPLVCLFVLAQGSTSCLYVCHDTFTHHTFLRRGTRLFLCMRFWDSYLCWMTSFLFFTGVEY